MTPCVAKLATALRATLAERHRELAMAIGEATTRLAGDATWTKLDGPAQAEILSQVGLVPPAPLTVETNDALRDALDERDLAAWRSEIDAASVRIDRALEEATKRLPDEGPTVTSVTVRRGTLSDAEAVRAWVAEHEAKLVDAVREGPVIVR